MEPKKDVLVRGTNVVNPDSSSPNVAPSPTNDEIFEEAKKDVTGQEPSPDQQPQDTQDDGIPSTQDVKPEVIDDRPIDNVAWEAKRKVDELLPKVDMILERLQQVNQEQPPKYTKAQLMTWANDPQLTVEQKFTVYSELEKLEKEERRKELEQLVTQTTQKTTNDVRRSQAAQWVAQAFPDTVVRDSFGNPAGWNVNHPVLLKANEYITRSQALRDDPEGFAAAVKMAAFDLGVQRQQQLSQKVDRTTAQLRKEQKKQLASSGGSLPSENADQLAKNRLRKLQDEYARTGSSEIFQEIVKLRGLNPWI